MKQKKFQMKLNEINYLSRKMKKKKKKEYIKKIC